MKTNRLFELCIVVCFATLSCNTESNYGSVFKAYENITKPSPFATELTLKENTYKGCFSDDYSTFYFFRKVTPDKEDYRILQSAFVDNKWSQPEEISFSDTNSDLYPMVSTIDPNKLFFISYRRTPSDTSQKPNANLWFTKSVNNDWEKPMPFEEANIIYNYNSQPCISKSGNIYFTSNSPDWSQTFTYKMEYEDGTYKNPVLFDYVNDLRTDTTKRFSEICVSPDEDYMILTISEEDQEAKLYLSSRDGETWTKPVYIGDIINEDMSGNFPYITKDGKYLIFTREFSSFLILPTKTFLAK